MCPRAHLRICDVHELDCLDHAFVHVHVYVCDVHELDHACVHLHGYVCDVNEFTKVVHGVPDSAMEQS